MPVASTATGRRRKGTLRGLPWTHKTGQEYSVQEGGATSGGSGLARPAGSPGGGGGSLAGTGFRASTPAGGAALRCPAARLASPGEVPDPTCARSAVGDPVRVHCRGRNVLYTGSASGYVRLLWQHLLRLLNCSGQARRAGTPSGSDSRLRASRGWIHRSLTQ